VEDQGLDVAGEVDHAVHLGKAYFKTGATNPSGLAHHRAGYQQGLMYQTARKSTGV
jgi:hypothetical protein